MAGMLTSSISRSITPMAYSEKERGVDLVVRPPMIFVITFMIDYKNPALGTQYTTLWIWQKEFVDEFAAASDILLLV